MSGNEPANPYGPPEPDNNNATGETPSTPKFGQRSENWTPPTSEPTPSNQVPSAPQFGRRSDTWSPNQPGAQAQNEQSSPWPVYGQTENQPRQRPPEAGPAGQIPYSGPGQFQPQNQYSQQGQYPNGQYPGPAQYPQGPYAGPTPYTQGQYGVPNGEMPSRTGAILTLIGGIFLMVIVAPIVFFSLVMGAVGMDRIVEGGMQTTNGGTMNVGSTGVVAVLPLAGDATSCELTDSSGGTTELYYEAQSGGTHVGRGISEGQYTIECEGVPTGSELMVMDGSVLAEIVDGTVKALVWATVIGLVGLATTIGGIIWLVKRNQARRAYLQGRPY